MQPRIGYRIPRREYIRVKGGNFTEYVQVPRQSTYKEAAIFYEPLGQNFYGSTGTSWISLGGGVAPVLNANDVSGTPTTPHYIALTSGHLRNIKSANTTVTTTTDGNSIVIGYNPTYNPLPVTTPFIRPIKTDGNVAMIYSTSANLVVAEDPDGNYSLTALGGGGSVVSAPETVVSTNQATLVNGNAEVRRLIGGSGMMVTDTYIGDDNYATLQGYDYSNDIQTIGDAAFSDAITIAIPDSTGYLFKIYIRGYNTTTNKVYSYDYTVSAKALSGVVSVSSAASMQVVEDLDPVVVSFAGGPSFKVKVKGLAGATINWSTKVRKI